ncbi:MAG: diaminopimelate epimerase [Rhodospirillales bacterium]
MTGLPFTKMHGLGNDFVVLDGRRGSLGVGPAEARAIADRRLGIGCDQLLVLEPPRNDKADVYLRIFNADGGETEACGNGTRCVGVIVMDEMDAVRVRIETVAGILLAEAAEGGGISVDMGPVAFAWRDIPLAGPADTLHLDFEAGPLRDPVAVSVGNPHVVFFVDDADAVALEVLGPVIETDPLFPQRTNVELAQVLDDGATRLRVWERGVGITRACGSGACAAVVAANRRELMGRSARVDLDGGSLGVTWRDDNHVVLTGPVATSFSGVVDPAILAGAGAGAAAAQAEAEAGS